MQSCDEKCASQRWVPGKTAGTVQLDGTALCLQQNGTAMGVVLAPCNAMSTVWGMKSDDTNVHVGTAGSGGKLCMENANSQVPVLKPCIYTGPIPPVRLFDTTSFGSQAYVWVQQRKRSLVPVTANASPLGLRITAAIMGITAKVGSRTTEP